MSNPRIILSQENVIDNLTSTSTIYPLSANQGRILQNQIDSNLIGVNGKVVYDLVSQNFFLFPSDVADQLFIRWNITYFSPSIFRSSISTTPNLQYSFLAVWSRASQEDDPQEHRFNGNLSGGGSIERFFSYDGTFTNAPSLQNEGDSLKCVINFYNPYTDINFSTNLNFMINTITTTTPEDIKYIKVFGYYEVLS